MENSTNQMEGSKEMLNFIIKFMQCSKKNRNILAQISYFFIAKAMFALVVS